MRKDYDVTEVGDARDLDCWDAIVLHLLKKMFKLFIIEIYFDKNGTIQIFYPVRWTDLNVKDSQLGEYMFLGRRGGGIKYLEGLKKS